MQGDKNITPVAFFRSPFSSKFGVPRQSGVVEELEGRIVFTREFAREEAIRGLEGFDYLWLIWGFSGNEGKWSLTVRPPRLGGNKSVGVFASRSPFRPNGLGLSSAKIIDIDLNGPEGPAIIVAGADLMDGTPIYDIKPYVAYSDAHEGARSGFTDETAWHEAEVNFPEDSSKNSPDSARRQILKKLSSHCARHWHRSRYPNTAMTPDAFTACRSWDATSGSAWRAIA